MSNHDNWASLTGFIDPNRSLSKVKCYCECVNGKEAPKTSRNIDIILLTFPTWNSTETDAFARVAVAYSRCCDPAKVHRGTLLSRKITTPYHKDQKNMSWAGDVVFEAEHGMRNRCYVQTPGLLYLIALYDPTFLVLSYIEKVTAMHVSGTKRFVDLDTIVKCIDQEWLEVRCDQIEKSRCSCVACSWSILKPMYKTWITERFPVFCVDGVFSENKILEWLTNKIEKLTANKQLCDMETVVRYLYSSVLRDSPLALRLLCKNYKLAEASIRYPKDQINPKKTNHGHKQSTLTHFFASTNKT